MLPERGAFYLGRKTRTSPDQQINAVKEYLEGNGSMQIIAERYGTAPTSLRRWISKYASMGVTAFYQTGNKHYTSSEKEQAVVEYLSGKGSLNEICRKYKILSDSQLRQWIKKYNGHEKLKASGTGGTIIMTKGRKTTFEERIEIASYCISHDHNYAETAERFFVSYQQARNYTVKYENGGIDALQDNRGRRKPEDTLTEIERLRAELKLEKAKRQKAEMEASFLKKLDEIERRRG